VTVTINKCHLTIVWPDPPEIYVGEELSLAKHLTAQCMQEGIVVETIIDVPIDVPAISEGPDGGEVGDDEEGGVSVWGDGSSSLFAPAAAPMSRPSSTMATSRPSSTMATRRMSVKKSLIKGTLTYSPKTVHGVFTDDDVGPFSITMTYRPLREYAHNYDVVQMTKVLDVRPKVMPSVMWADHSLQYGELVSAETHLNAKFIDPQSYK
jgi:hypothetical protein